MMRSWTKFLPFVFVEWFAKRNLAKQFLGKTSKRVVSPYKGVYLEVGYDE